MAELAKYKSKSNGFALTFLGPASVEDYNRKAGREGATLEDAVGAEIAWGTLPEWASQFVARLEKLTGVPTRGIDEKATEKAKAAATTDEAKAKVKSVKEKEKSYIGRVRAAVDAGQVTDENGNPVTAEALKALAQQVADQIEIDPSPSKRTGAPRKDDLEKADALLAGDADELEAKLSAWSQDIDFDLQRDDSGRPVRESLARFVGKRVDFVRSSL